MIRFILNHQTVQTEMAQGGTVLDFVRYHKRLTGTKIGCREGDCGACTVLVGDFEDGQLQYRSATSCLMPLGNAHGKHIVTVEGINMAHLSPVQQTMLETNGTQCGFCTIGFVMSLTGFVMDKEKKDYGQAIASMDGNICRCTGYKSIERAAQLLAEKVTDKPAEQTLQWLVDHQFIPAYFTGIEARLQQIKKDNQPLKNKLATLTIGGGTDLNVQKHHIVKHAPLTFLYDSTPLKGIRKVKGQIEIGASVTVTQFAESPFIQAIFADLHRYIKLVSSTPIRNMATLAGNFVNASPIGDMTVFFLALDASIVLKNKQTKRTVQLSDFYKGYKVMDKAPEETIEKIVFTPPTTESYFNFEKVCKRTYLDIASVNSACHIQLGKDGIIEAIHLSAGGVAPYPKYLSQTCAFLKGKALNTENVAKALELVQQEVAPISDARGTTDYKRLLLRQLVIAHVQKLPQGTAIVAHLLKPASAQYV